MSKLVKRLICISIICFVLNVAEGKFVPKENVCSECYYESFNW